VTSERTFYVTRRGLIDKVLETTGMTNFRRQIDRSNRERTTVINVIVIGLDLRETATLLMNAVSCAWFPEALLSWKRRPIRSMVFLIR
jgi:hypothetical protein